MRRWSRRTAAISATTRPASRPARPASTFRCSSARSPPTTRSARRATILEQNIFGGMCARVCPTETLCEEACVREAAEGKPVAIGELQRYATDAMMETGKHPVCARGAHGQARRRRRRRAGRPRLRPSLARRRPRRRRSSSARPKDRRPQRIRHRRLQDAGRLRRARGRVHPRRSAASRSRPATRSAATSRWASCGRITTRSSSPSAWAASTRSASPARTCCQRRGRRRLSSPACARRRISPRLPVGRRVVVIGGGMTAIDIAMQSKRLGAEHVTIVYRRGPEHMRRAATSASSRRPMASRSASGRARSRSKAMTARCPASSSNARAMKTASSSAPARPSARGRHGVQGDRPDRRAPTCSAATARDGWRAAASRSTPSGAPACPASGRAATASVGGLDLTVAAVEDGKRRGALDRRCARLALELKESAHGRSSHDFLGIKSPNPFWLASAPPTDKEDNVVRAFKAGWGGVVWKTLGEDGRRSSTSPARATAPSMPGPPPHRLQQYRADHRPRPRDQSRRRSSRSSATGPTALWSSR